MVCASLPYIHIIAPEADKVHSTRSLEDTIAFKDIAFLLSFLLFFLNLLKVKAGVGGQKWIHDKSGQPIINRSKSLEASTSLPTFVRLFKFHFCVCEREIC